MDKTAVIATVLSIASSATEAHAIANDVVQKADVSGLNRPEIASLISDEQKQEMKLPVSKMFEEHIMDKAGSPLKGMEMAWYEGTFPKGNSFLKHSKTMPMKKNGQKVGANSPDLQSVFTAYKPV